METNQNISLKMSKNIATINLLKNRINNQISKVIK